MGMYTEIVAAFKLKKDAPAKVVEVLRYMAERADLAVPSDLPFHPFFACDRWRAVMLSDSYYFPGDTHSTVRYDEISNAWHVTIRANLKNYDGEIEAFVDWLSPYIVPDCERDDGSFFIGYSRYEEAAEPTLLFVGAKES